MKPKILFVCDVEGWAWDIKTQYIKKYLSEYYDIDIIYTCYNKNKVDKQTYDLLFSFGFAFNHHILSKNKNKDKCITGLTAHRKKNQVIKAMNEIPNHHANSVLLYNELKGFGKNPFYVPNGVDADLFHPILPHFYRRLNLVIGHVGKKSPNKNQSSFIEPLFNKVESFYEPHYNDCFNKIPHDQMPGKYQSFDMLIVASTEDGTPNSLLEAAACERSAFINKIGNAPELIKDGYNGFLLNKDENEYIDKIIWCQKNKDKVIEMGKNARKEILKGWTWEIMSKNYLFLFDSVLGIKRNKDLYENPALDHIPGYREEKGL